MQEPAKWIEQLLRSAGVSGPLLDVLSRVGVIVAVVILAALANFAAKRVILRALTAFIARTPTRWDDYFLQHRVFERFSHLAPAVVIYASASIMFPKSEALQTATQHLAIVYMMMVAAIAVDGVLNGVAEIYGTFEVAKTRPIKTYIQVVKIIVFLATAIFVIATVTNRSPWGLLSGLGAMTAILMLVFKDTVLGLVASVQVTAHDMVRPGDWIEMPKYGADGDVIEVTLNTVKIRNWDKTISTIPTYALVSETFKNWRGMSESGGRRIKRALWLDQTSVRFCDDSDLDRLGKLEAIADYVKSRRQDVLRYNTENKVDVSSPVNGRRLTNLGTFRAYVLAYLKRHPNVHREMTLLVRHLAPGPTGIGIEIYCFSNDQAWANYESIQADIFDHLLAVLPFFDLRVFQNPSGSDVRAALVDQRMAS